MTKEHVKGALVGMVITFIFAIGTSAVSNGISASHNHDAKFMNILEAIDFKIGLLTNELHVHDTGE